MTVTSSSARRVHEGNDSATVFSFDFPITAPADLRVVLSAADGSESELVEGSDYAVSVAALPGTGSVLCPLSGPPLPAGTRLILRRQLAIDQQVDLQNQGNFYAETHEGVFDRIVMICQQLADAVARTAKLPVSSTLGELFLPAPAAGRALLWNADADGLANGPTADEIAAAAGHAGAAEAAQVAAESARAAAQAAGAAAEAAAAALDLPALGPGSAGARLAVVDDETARRHVAPLALARRTLVLAGGLVAPDAYGSCFALDTEGGAAADALERIDATAVPDGALLLLTQEHAARAVTLRHAAAPASGDLLPLLLADGADLVPDLAPDAAATWLLLARRGQAFEEVARSRRQGLVQPDAVTLAAPTPSVVFAGIPPGVRRIVVAFQGLSHASPLSTQLWVQIGSGGAAETTGYVAGAQPADAGFAAPSTGNAFNLSHNIPTGTSLHGALTLRKLQDHLWVATGVASDGASFVTLFAGSKFLAGALDSVRIVVGDGNDLDAGTISITY